jgi:hypothetical protein
MKVNSEFATDFIFCAQQSVKPIQEKRTNSETPFLSRRSQAGWRRPFFSGLRGASPCNSTVKEL